MTTGYFAQVDETGQVTDLRRVSADRIAEYPDLYQGKWVEVSDMDQYPAIGWTWTLENGFIAPTDIGAI